MSSALTIRSQLEEAIRERTAKVSVIGLGGVGLAEAVAAAQAGFSVVGIDIDATVIEAINDGREVDAQAGQAPEADIRSLVERGALQATSDLSLLAEATVVLLCVPTPIVEGRADLSAIERSLEAVAETWAEPKLVVIVSTVPPGTTRQMAKAFLKARGHQAGRDFFLAVCPERIALAKPGETVQDLPRVIGGLTPDCTELASTFFKAFVPEVHPASTPEVAEASKILENTFRFVNISLVNEWSLLCTALGIDVWEVIDAASTKPAGFLKHQPGPGVGGACIPWAPYYVLPDAHALGTPTDIMEASLRINALMPERIVQRTMELASDYGAHILVIGVTFRPDVPDIRESPAIPSISLLRKRGFRVSYWDPLIPYLAVDGEGFTSLNLERESPPQDIACAVIITPHSNLDYAALCDRVPRVFDTRNALATLNHPNIVRL